LAACAATLSAQVAQKANERYQTEQERESMGRGLGSSGRDATQKPAELVARMGIRPGMTVADIGTGVGYMLPFLSRAVGEGGRVLAEDIFPDFLKKAEEKARAEKLPNVSFVRGGDKDPGLPGNAVDVALALDSYHHYDYPREMLSAIRRSLRPDGRLVIVEYYKRPNAIGRGDFALEHVRLDKPDAIREIEAGGFRLVSEFEQIPGSQYGLVFRKAEANPAQ
jgi:ubiquinone/menaquinone biosynthesis C-methylase UbiE